MKYIVITASIMTVRLFDSKPILSTSLQLRPSIAILSANFAEECRKQSIKLGFYYSQDRLDGSRRRATRP